MFLDLFNKTKPFNLISKLPSIAHLNLKIDCLNLN